MGIEGIAASEFPPYSEDTMQSTPSTYPELTGNPAWRCLAQLDSAAQSIETDRDAIRAVFQALLDARNQMSGADWAEFAHGIRNHELWDVFCQDPLTRRAFDKPRGYAGDAVMMDLVYGVYDDHPVWARSTGIGRDILSFIRQGDAGAAVRWRREHIARCIDAVAAGRPASVLAIAAGHLREAELSRAIRTSRLQRFVALDADPYSLREIDASYGKYGVETIHASVRHLLARKCDLAGFDFVYAAGLFDYLNDKTARALTARMFEMTAPGGLVMVPNFAPAVAARPYMEAFMDWSLIYRDEQDMAKLLDGLDPASIQRTEIYADPNRAVVYLVIQKTK
jgi:extracellular factor (EF) 3-hydroxypalmitic acid methyl ester biosynthesis protein